MLVNGLQGTREENGRVEGSALRSCFFFGPSSAVLLYYSLRFSSGSLFPPVSATGLSPGSAMPLLQDFRSSDLRTTA